MNGIPSPAALDHEVMAMLLTTNVQLVARVLQADEHAPGQLMRAIAATRSLDTIVEDALHALVDEARAAGHTWAEIGTVLRVSRQAAFQRFGGPRLPGGDRVGAAPLEGADEDALDVLDAFLSGRFEEMRARFAGRMLDAFPVEALAAARDQVRSHAGEVQGLGPPAVSAEDGFTVVEVPLALDRADGIGRVVLNADRQVAGFSVRPRPVQA